MPTKRQTRRDIIKAQAIEVLKANPEGLRYSPLVQILHEKMPDYPVNTIHGTVWDLEMQYPEEFFKPERGLYKLSKYRESKNKELEPLSPEVEKKREEKIYKPFSDWLIGMDECTKAIPLGGNLFKDKWGTPDVLGIREPLRSDIIKPPIEIIAAEIKIDTRDLITAFGQACSYRVFSHKSYIVVPKTSSKEDLSRLDALCLIFGIGLVLFDNSNIGQPDFEIRTRPQKHEPDMFYVNKYLKLVEKELF